MFACLSKKAILPETMIWKVRRQNSVGVTQFETKIRCCVTVKKIISRRLVFALIHYTCRPVLRRLTLSNMLLTNPQNSCAFELHIMSRGGLPVLVYNTEENRTTPIRARPASSSLFHHIFPIQFVFLLLSNKECAIYIRGNV